MSMEDPKLSAPLALKDYFVFVPLAGSALAISWEIGSFYPISGAAFGAFSLAEHLAFALQAFPLGYVIALGASILYSVGTLRRARASFRSKARIKRLSVVLLLGLSLGASAALGLALGMWDSGAHTIPYITFVSLCLVSLVLLLLLASDLPPYTTSAWLLLLAFFLAFSLGVDSTRIAIEKAPISVIETDTGKLEIRVLRANPSAIVGYDPTSSYFVLLKGDRVKQRAWREVPYHF
jgi:hypothetical protein